jgi:hypothetical protein
VTQASAPRRQSTSKPNKDINQEQRNKTQKHHQLDVLEPHPPLQRPTPDPEVLRILSQTTRLVNQHVHMLAPLHNALNVLDHNVVDLTDFSLRSLQGIILAVKGTLFCHEPLQGAVEARTPVWRQVGEVCILGVKLCEELFLKFYQEAKGNSLPEFLVRNDQERQAAS